MTEPGCLGVEGKGKAPHWRLTELGYMRDPPTQDFLRWNGEPFRDRPPRRKKQNSGPQTGARMDHKLVPVVDHKLVPGDGTSGPQTGAIREARGGPQTGAISSIPLPGPSTACPRYIINPALRQAYSGAGSRGRYQLSADPRALICWSSAPGRASPDISSDPLKNARGERAGTQDRARRRTAHPTKDQDDDTKVA